MNKRLVRAEAEDQGGGDPVPRPAGHLLPDRLAAVLAVVYLIFNEGYGGASTSPPRRSGWGARSRS